MSRTRLERLLCAISLAALLLGCGRYGPPVRPVASRPEPADSRKLDDPPPSDYGRGRDEPVPYVLEGMIDDDTESNTPQAEPEDPSEEETKERE